MPSVAKWHCMTYGFVEFAWNNSAKWLLRVSFCFLCNDIDFCPNRRSIDNMQNITRPIQQVVILIEYRLENIHAIQLAKQIIACPVTKVFNCFSSNMHKLLLACTWICYCYWFSTRSHSWLSSEAIIKCTVTPWIEMLI